jgi:hypothetical protein
MIEIFLPVSNRQVFGLVYYSDSKLFIIRKEVKEWLNKLPGSYSTSWEDTEEGEGCIFRFYDDREAVLFKLVWG